jgi:hypothetical protein
LDWKKISSQFKDFNEHKQKELTTVMKSCSKDLEFPLSKPYDTDHENFKFFALCIRSNVAINPVLNSSEGVRKSVLGWTY